MAYAALCSLAETLDRFRDHDRHRFHPLPFENQQIQSLHEDIVSLMTFLEDFPGEAGKFEARIAVAANLAEDIIDYHILNKDDREYRIRRHVQYVLNCFRLAPLSPYKELLKPKNEIGSILKQAKKIKSSRSKNPTHSSCYVASRLCAETFDGEDTAVVFEEEFMEIKGRFCAETSNGKDTIVGFEEELMEIKGRLCGEPSKLQVIPIVGMAGIGKTTLARYAYDAPLTAHHFDVRAWVTISQKFDLRRFLLSLLHSIGILNTDEYQLTDDELMVQRLYKYLKQRRYLVVMDDVWNTNVWDDVRRIFPDDPNGSRIIITTRELGVAFYFDPLRHPLQMHLMDVGRSWDLLRQKVFALDNCPPELEKIGKLIAENCRGLPLAIVVISGILSKVDKTQDAWRRIAENVIEVVNTSDEQIPEILSLSYTHLPHHLRPCFLYMGGFPEDHEINASKLVKLWAAEGFLRSNEAEDMGNKYLEDLAKRSLVLINKKRYDGKVKAVKLHDLLRDLCLRKAQDEKFLHVINQISPSFPDRTENSRHLSILSRISGVFHCSNGSHIRTLLIFHHWAFDSWKAFKLLRVLDAMNVTFKSYPYQIEDLHYLRYLAFTNGFDSKKSWPRIPKISWNLRNLQTLIIRPLDIFKGGTIITIYMSLEMWKMPQLRHLILLDGVLPDPDETYGQISALWHLQTLSRIEGLRCSERILKMIPNLKKLGLVYSYGTAFGSGWSMYGLNNLIHLRKLEKLSIFSEPYANLKNDLSQNLAFPPTLKRLTLSGCRFAWKDMTLVGSLPNLEMLKLKRHACEGTEWETNEEEFSQLKVLLIDDTQLLHWTTESSHFPRLEHLVLYKCNDLGEIPYGIGEIPTLQLIEVDVRNSSIVESAKFIKEEQQSFGNDLEVRVLNSRSWAI